MLRIRLLGGIRLETDGRELPPPRGRPGRELLAWLALHPASHGRSRLAGLLRPDASEDAARQGVRQALWALRQALDEPAADALVARRDEVGLAEAEIEVDVVRLLRLVEAGDLEAARSLAGATLLPELDAEWVGEARAELRERVGGHAARLAEETEQRADLEGALRWARVRAELDPLSESAQRELVRLLAATGDRAAAVRAAAALRERLMAELGVVPSAETRELIQRVLADEPAADADVAASQLGAETIPADGAPSPPIRTDTIPPALRAAAAAPLVDRDAELAALQSTWAATVRGGPKIVLVAGEPGIGKTALAAMFAREVDGTVLYGRCDEHPLGPYQPFVEALDQAVRGEALTVDSLSEHQLAELGRVLPSLAGRTPPSAGDPDQARYRLFEATAAAFEVIAAAHPVLLVLDDLDWGDPATPALLRYLMRRLSNTRMMVLGTYRDTAGHPFARALADIRRETDLVELAPGALSERGVEELASRHGIDAAQLHRRTGGNPLFVVEALAEGGGAEIPVAVRDLIDQRVAGLGEDARAVLRTAAVAGERFELGDLEAAGELGAERVLTAVEAALGARLIRERPGAPGSYAFEHALVQETLYAGTSEARRATIHARLGRALANREAPPAAVSRHLLAAGPLADPEETLAWTERAANDALTALAYEDAAALYRQALELGPTGGAVARDREPSPAGGAAPRGHRPSPARGRLLLGLGDALDRAGERDDARGVFLQAGALARETGDARLLADAALGYQGHGLTISAPDPQAVELLEQAIGAIESVDRERHARLLARLALEIYYDDPRRSDALSRAAVERSRDLDTLSARHASLWSAEGAAERLAIATEMRETAVAAGQRIPALQARNWRVLDLLELGRVDEAEEEIDAYAGEATDLRLPRYAWYVPLWRAGLAVLRGDFERAEELSAQAHGLGRRAQDANADTYRVIQRIFALIEQRRFSEIDLDEYERRFASAPGGRGSSLGWLAWLHAEQGNLGPARTAFAELAADDFALLPRDANWHSACDAAEACAALGDAAAAQPLLDLLRPHAALYPVVGRGIGCLGPVTYFLGLLEATRGEHAQAARHFEHALAACESIGAHPRAELCRQRLSAARRA